MLSLVIWRKSCHQNYCHIFLPILTCIMISNKVTIKEKVQIIVFNQIFLLDFREKSTHNFSELSRTYLETFARIVNFSKSKTSTIKKLYSFEFWIRRARKH